MVVQWNEWIPGITLTTSRTRSTCLIARNLFRLNGVAGFDYNQLNLILSAPK